VTTERGRSRPIALLDLPWLAMDTRRHPMHVAGLIICQVPDGAVPNFVPDLVADMKRDGAVTDPFGRRVSHRGWGRLWPRWESAEPVDLEQHVRTCALPAPGGERELSLLVSDLHRTQLVRGRPLWEITFIDGLAENRFAIYAKFHHSLVDGVGAVRVLRSAFSTDAARRDMPPIWAFAADRRRPRQPARSRRAVLLSLPKTVRAAARAIRADGRDLPYSAPRTVLNTAISAERRVVVASWDTDLLRAKAETMGGTMNDALLGVCATGLRHYLADRKALPTRPLIAAVPTSVRPTDADDLGNAISFAFVSLATDIENGPERDATIVTSTVAAKAHLAELPKSVIDAYTVMTMGPFIAGQLLGVGARTRPMFNVAISNLPGPSAPLFHNGVPVLGIHPVSVLQSGQALNITALSYAGRLDITFTACAEALSDVQELADRCTAALQGHAQDPGPGRGAGPRLSARRVTSTAVRRT
jgi:diacylglycerol O-acyltransferase